MNWIDVKELRIGNLVEWYGKYYPIIQIKENNACIEDLSNDFDQLHWLPVLSPIVLTPEILIKVGFTERSNSQGTYYHIKHEEFDGYAYDLEKKCISTYYPAACNGFCSLDIKYLHQLQNVLFFNAGIELIYTP